MAREKPSAQLHCAVQPRYGEFRARIKRVESFFE